MTGSSCSSADAQRGLCQSLKASAQGLCSELCSGLRWEGSATPAAAVLAAAAAVQCGDAATRELGSDAHHEGHRLGHNPRPGPYWNDAPCTNMQQGYSC